MNFSSFCWIIPSSKSFIDFYLYLYIRRNFCLYAFFMMYKKITDFEQRISSIAYEIVWLDIDIITNPNPFPQLQTLQNKISDLEKTTSHFPSDLKKEMINDLKNFSNSLKCSFYAIFKQYIEQYITNTNLVLLFMINYPQLFSEDFDIESSPFIEIYSLFWHFLADIHVTSSTPELFPELCKIQLHCLLNKLNLWLLSL